MGHLTMEQLEAIAKGGLEIDSLTEVEREHLRNCTACIRRFCEYIRQVIRAKDEPSPSD